MGGHAPPPWTGYSFVKTIHSSAPDYLNPRNQQLKSGSVVCITGASRGIGAATAKAYAEAGVAGLVLTARTEEALKQTVETCSKVGKRDLKVYAVGADVGSASASGVIRDVIDRNFGRLDILINNAGIMCTNASAFDKLDAQDDEQFSQVTDVNYIGRLRLIKALVPLMRSSSDGAKIIVNLSSMSAHFTLGTPMYVSEACKASHSHRLHVCMMFGTFANLCALCFLGPLISQSWRIIGSPKFWRRCMQMSSFWCMLFTRALSRQLLLPAYLNGCSSSVRTMSASVERSSCG